MRAKFAGGVLPETCKAATEQLRIVELPPPPLAVIPLQQHIGPKSRPLVKPGDYVLRGQKIVRVRIGTPLRQLIEACGGLSPATVRLIMGGPMMGIAQTSLDAPVIKGTAGLLALTRDEVPARRAGNCIRCGRCVRACPMGLLPNTLALFAQRRLFDRAEADHAMVCIECGDCAYVCPAAIPLVQHIRLAKSQIAEVQHNRVRKE